MSWLHSVQFSAKGRVQNSDPLLSRQTKKNSSALAQKDRRQESFSVLSDATVTMLIALKDAAVIAPVPYIGEAVGLAIGIWKNVQSGLLKLFGKSFKLLQKFTNNQWYWQC
ncbi:hypothetical protein F5876DRAFT_64934 [Lentinula aff. lateritia]|uniref:Uncharacterized protein n=1 Tax=Lentinula aff. lateritia TaxID=2804960 RepID=A0ACC1U2I9_9AGAR|nr:hypothetical protein F5876DRAFT_64934 [Lentinula aff. lateritia]